MARSQHADAICPWERLGAEIWALLALFIRDSECSLPIFKILFIAIFRAQLIWTLTRLLLHRVAAAGLPALRAHNKQKLRQKAATTTELLHPTNTVVRMQMWPGTTAGAPRVARSRLCPSRALLWRHAPHARHANAAQGRSRWARPGHALLACASPSARSPASIGPWLCWPPCARWLARLPPPAQR